MMDSRLFASRHGIFLNAAKYYYGKEGAFEGQIILKHKVEKSLIEGENYEGLKGDRGMVEYNH